METRRTEIADGIHQLTTHVEEMNFSFNQYVVTGDEPLLFHTGPRQMFPLVSGAVAGVMPVDQLRWITFGHVEADECGAMNDWLAAAPQSTVAQSTTGCIVSLNDLADRAPRTLFCGDLFTQTGSYSASSADDIVGPAIAAEDIFHSCSLAPASGSTVRRLADLDVTTLALMHGPAFTGDCHAALLDLADDFDKRIAAAS